MFTLLELKSPSRLCMHYNAQNSSAIFITRYFTLLRCSLRAMAEFSGDYYRKNAESRARWV